MRAFTWLGQRAGGWLWAVGFASRDTAGYWAPSGLARPVPEATGKPMAAFDSLIAATALKHGLAVVTRNVSDFAHAAWCCSILGTSPQRTISTLQRPAAVCSRAVHSSIGSDNPAPTAKRWSDEICWGQAPCALASTSSARTVTVCFGFAVFKYKLASSAYPKGASSYQIQSILLSTRVPSAQISRPCRLARRVRLRTVPRPAAGHRRTCDWRWRRLVLMPTVAARACATRCLPSCGSGGARA